ncbi:hypothetical protein K443DRAFT_130488 [Laccaria amethystina LaAM-08-1]|uniref:CCHC-type domain-containing protein n=1 Tax=Laccaria amethystina LaAM-08-1 TaxID=1095629 RepID=A0A0C9WZT4_9AGAR|nr:hypothetical protein K443DRAFT_130488 [Laccaria amethystina LaAM-08-1]
MVEPQSSRTEEPATTDQMEDHFYYYGIRNDQDKKKKLGKYADQQTEFEWKAFDQYADDHTFADFKKALIDDYPKAQMAGKGTSTTLKKSPTKIADGTTSSVDMFLGCLRESFASQVRSSLNIEQTKDWKQKGKEDASVRRPEDPYDIIDIIDMAETIAGRLCGNTRDQLNLASSAVLLAHTTGSLHEHEQAIKSESDEFDELQNITADFADQVKIEQKQNTELCSQVQNTQIEMKKLLETLAQQHPGVSNPQTKHVTYKMTADGCWYCEEMGHFTMNCPHREEHINQHKIKLQGHKLYFVHNNLAACRQITVMQNNMFAEPGEVYKQESVPGIIRIADSSNGNEFSAFTNQIRDKRDDVILNMNNKIYMDGS